MTVVGRVVEAPAPDPVTVPDGFIDRLQAATGDKDALKALWFEAKNGGFINADIDAQVKALATVERPQPADPDVVDAEVIDEQPAPAPAVDEDPLADYDAAGTVGA